MATEDDYNDIYKLVDKKWVKLPCPSSMEWGLSDVSSDEAGRVMSGNTLMYKMRLSQKVTLKLTWNAPTKTDTKTILQAFNDEYLTVKYFDPMEGAPVSKEFYVGDRSAPFLWLHIGDQRMSQVSFDIIER